MTCEKLPLVSAQMSGVSSGRHGPVGTRAWRVSLGVIALLLPVVTRAATITVTNASDLVVVGDGVSLREAILSLNGGANINADVVPVGPYGTSDAILFNIPGGGLHTIHPSSALPAITVPLQLDGYSQPGASPNTTTLGDNAALLIELDGSGLSGSEDGLAVAAGGCLIRGLVINRFPGNGISLQGPGGDLIAGNFIGTNAAGTSGLGNASNGILVASHNDRIGGGIADRNLISGNAGDGISFAPAGAGDTTVQGNFIGSDVTGFLGIGNQNGISVFEVTVGVAVGGPTSSPGTPPGNLISGNRVNGIQAKVLVGGLAQVMVSGNLIGTTVDGLGPLGNLQDGVQLSGSRNSVIGGSTSSSRNVISGNTTGLHLTGTLPVSFENIVAGNYIGTNILGTAAIPNAGDGVLLDTAFQNVIGGSQPGQGNVISGNGGNGIMIASSSPTENRVVGNLVGTDPAGSFGVPNQAAGIAVDLAENNAIGEPGAGNTIAFNIGPGVRLSAAFDPVRGNAIFVNGGLGIDEGLGPNPNVPCGEGNVPVLAAVTGGGQQTHIQGTLNSKFPLSVIDFYASSSCDPSGYGEGQRYLGSTTLTTSVGCDASFDVLVPAQIHPGEVVTATATNQFNTTTQFSACMPVQGLAFYTVTPCRVADTRVAAGSNGGPSLAANGDRVFPIGDQCGIPSGAQAVAFNFTVTGSTAGGNLRITAGPGAGGTSSLNYGASQTRANNAILALGLNGEIDVHVTQPSGTVDLIIDVTGYFQ